MSVLHKRLLFVGYFGLSSYFYREYGISLIFLLVGAIVGWNFGIIDRLVYVYVRRPHEHFSQHVRHLLTKGRIMDILMLIQKRGHEQIRLWSESVLFLPLWFLLILYVATSSTSLFSLGMLLGMGLWYVGKMVGFLGDVSQMRQWYWMVAGSISEKVMKWTIYGYFLVFSGVTLMVW